MIHTEDNAAINQEYLSKEAVERQIEEYSLFLESNNLDRRAIPFYWQIGSLTKAQGWILHLSVIPPMCFNLLKLVVPFLLKEKVSFKIPHTLDIANSLAIGSLGYQNLGKIVGVYPETDLQALDIATRLVQLTQEFRGPDIPTDRQLGNIVYTRYGSFDPIMRKNSLADQVKYIYDGSGTLVPDLCAVPFSLPAGIDWPFSTLASANPPKKEKLLDFTYFPVHKIKSDAKGNVLKALYFEKPWKISSCVIKEGKKNMFADDYDRDIRDRLRWQYELHKDLQIHLPIPKALGFFSQHERAYLVIQYLKGKPLSVRARDIHKDMVWQDLPMLAKIKILALLLQVLQIIQKLHKLGYVHRDITSENVYVGKRDTVSLIDLELAWSIKRNYPTPPFQLGTYGFMSPEQQKRSKLPTVKQDIYALGALVMNMLTGFYPFRFDAGNRSNLINALNFLIGDKRLVQLITNCLHRDPDQRPSISLIIRCVRDYRSGLSPAVGVGSSSVPLSFSSTIDKEKIIENSISGMNHPDFLNSRGHWVSPSQRHELNIDNRQYDVTLMAGWHTGMSGPLWLATQAKLMNFSIEACDEPLNNSWEYIRSYLDGPEKDRQPGLYTGAAGIGLTISAMFDSQLLPADEENKAYLERCFSTMAPFGGLRNGLAGQGIALLSSVRWLSQKTFSNKLQTYIDVLLKAQLPNGAWPTGGAPGKNRVNTGLSNGVAGMIWFLLSSIPYARNDKVKDAISKGLSWLKSETTFKKGIPSWTVSTKTKQSEPISTSHGEAGIALTFIKAYEVLGDPYYKQIAEKWLQKLNKRLLAEDYSLANGLAGIGELYFEAHKAFGGQTWYDRAQWIAELLWKTTHKKSDSQVFWVTNDFATVTMDLFTGNSGIIHFLLRSIGTNTLSHPFSVPRSPAKSY